MKNIKDIIALIIVIGFVIFTIINLVFYMIGGTNLTETIDIIKTISTIYGPLLGMILAHYYKSSN